MHATRKLPLAIRFNENGSVQCFMLCAFPLSISVIRHLKLRKCQLALTAAFKTMC